MKNYSNTNMSGLKIETRNTKNAPNGAGPCSQAVALPQDALVARKEI